MQLIARHYRTGQPTQVELTGQRIAALGPPAALGDGADLPWISPGWVDLQINGYLGQEFVAPDLTVDKVARLVEQVAGFGVTRFCPTVTTAERTTLERALGTLARACAESPPIDAAVAALHLEGPYISAEDGPRGAHPLAHCRPPDWDEFQSLQAAAEGRIGLLTLSPEFPGAAAFISQVVASGVRVAIGHTAANAAQIRAAVDAGATLSTHLGNGAHRLLPRHPNYLWDQLADDRLSATLIADGYHLPPAVVKTFVRAKTPARLLLVSDLSGLAGLPPGEYGSELCRLEILNDGRLVVAGQRELLAGASQPIGVGIANLLRFADLDLATAVESASHRPLRALGLPAVELEVGAVADLVLFHVRRDAEGRPAGIQVVQTIARGSSAFACGSRD